MERDLSQEYKTSLLGKSKLTKVFRSLKEIANCKRFTHFEVNALRGA